MSDLFDLPPDRELPDATRLNARNRIVIGIRGEQRPKRALLTISIAAAAVALVGGAAGLVALHHPDSRTSAASGPASVVGHLAPALVFGPTNGGVRQGSAAPADQLARCAAQNDRKPAGRPDPSQWRPLFTSAGAGLNVIAFHTPAGPLFCELTPAMVTLSSPTSAAAGATARPTFVTAFGTVAGVYQPSVQPRHPLLWVKTTDGTSQLGALAWHQDGVFVAFNAVRVPATSLTITTAQTFTGPRHQVVVPDTGRLAVAPTQDRPLTPADQTSAAGHRLAECLANPGGGAAVEPAGQGAGEGGPGVDPAAWVPGASATTADQGSVQLGTYGDLLAVCISNPRQQPAVTLNVLSTSGAQLYTAANPYISVAEVAHITGPQPGVGFGVEPLLALPGVAKSADAATVTLSDKGKPTVTATVHSGGTFVMTGNGLNAYYRPNADPKGTLTVLSASGAVLAKVPLH